LVEGARRFEAARTARPQGSVKELNKQACKVQLGSVWYTVPPLYWVLGYLSGPRGDGAVSETRFRRLRGFGDATCPSSSAAGPGRRRGGRRPGAPAASTAPATPANKKQRLAVWVVLSLLLLLLPYRCCRCCVCCFC
jgi:hypothetical protein